MNKFSIRLNLLCLYFSFKECLYQCNDLSTCVGFAHNVDTCLMCRNDAYSYQTVPIDNRKHYLIDLDHLLLSLVIKGKIAICLLEHYLDLKMMALPRDNWILRFSYVLSTLLKCA